MGSSASSSSGCEQQRAGDRDALLLAARQLGRAVLGAVAEPDPVEQLAARAARARRRARPAISAGSSTFSSAVSERQQVEELEDEADVVAAQPGQLARRRGRRSARPPTATVPLGRRLERAEDVQQRALARAGRAHDRDELAGLDA